MRVRPALTLAFPPADITKIEKTGEDYLVTASFLGLYGPASPLPTFYTEQLLDESAADRFATRDFLDIFHHRLFTLFFNCLRKYRLPFWLTAQNEEECLERLFSLIGIGEVSLWRSLPEARTLLRYAGVISLRTRPALGLAAFLTDACKVPVKVIQCTERRIPVPLEDRLQLAVRGCTLGVDAVLGQEVTDRNGSFRLRVGPLDGRSFSDYLPETAGRKRLDALVRLYLASPLVWDVELVLRAEEIPATVLGTRGGRLGWDAWLAQPRDGCEASVVFPASSA